MSERIGLGFIGAGANTRLRHLPGFAEIDGVELVTVANRSEASSSAVAKEFGIGRVAEDWHSVIADPEVDAVCIGTWPYMHAEMTLAAMSAGKHVLTEARMASDLAGAEAMYAMAEASPELVAQIVPSPFTLEQDRTVVEILESGQLGELREVFIDHSMGAYLDPDAPMNWRQDVRYSGINMLTMGIYHEVIERWLPDSIEVLDARGSIFTPERIHWESGELTPVEIPDCIHVHGQLERGSLLNYHFSGIEAGPGRNEIKLVGSEATLRLDVGTGELFLSRRRGGAEKVGIPEEERVGWQVEADFIQSIREGAPVTLTSFGDGLRYMRFTDAVRRKLSS
ncbi:MAG: Gfo/Idh/MocA family protein [Puniceicoccaceae bacterium]